jgi:hypothetical protein
MSIRRRSLSLLVVGSFLVAALGFMGLPDSAWNLATGLAQSSKSRSQEDRKKLARKPAPSGTIANRLGADDGYGIVVFFSGDIHGNLEVCGCPIHPLGGVARRMGYINAFRKRSPGANTILVDTGNIFSDEVNADRTDLRADARLMNDWIVRANEMMPLSVVNLSYRDLRYASGLMSPDAKLKPEKSTLLSANIRSEDPSRTNAAPYTIVTVTAPRLKKPVRIAFIGLSDLAPDEYQEGVTASRFVIEDPLVAVKKALAEVADKADVNVIVGYLRMTTANKIANQNADVDVIIASDGRGLVPDPKQVNNALVMFGAKETKHLGELRMYTDGDGVVDRFTARYIELDDVITDDSAMAAVTKQARREIDAAQTRMAEAEAGYASGESPYAGTESCATCHKAEYQVWQKSRHSHAFAALETKQRIFDAACVGCHSVGFQKKGFVNIKATPQFANVGCESCHGPGAEHVKLPKKGTYPTPAAPSLCVSCHDRDNSPDFVFDKYWPLVEHSNSFKTVSKPTKGTRVKR